MTRRRPEWNKTFDGLNDFTHEAVTTQGGLNMTALELAFVLAGLAAAAWTLWLIAAGP